MATVQLLERNSQRHQRRWQGCRHYRLKKAAAPATKMATAVWAILPASAPPVAGKELGLGLELEVGATDGLMVTSAVVGVETVPLLTAADVAGRS
jgi:hypothetical protein